VVPEQVVHRIRAELRSTISNWRTPIFELRRRCGRTRAAAKVRADIPVCPDTRELGDRTEYGKNLRRGSVREVGLTHRLFDSAERELGNVSALVFCHCESVDSGRLDTTVESFDRHFAVSTRASWLLIRGYGLRFRGQHGTGRVVSLTSDHTVGNLACGASKGAMDRITLAAARELADLGVTCNAINPGPTDTGWMNRTAEGAHDHLHISGTPRYAAGLARIW
jgi:3-oxoacyl-[acyl-carrier protein] reductase